MPENEENKGQGSAAVEHLARTLYESLEHLAPGAGDYVEWDDLPQWGRDLHLNAVERLLVERDTQLYT